MNLRSAAGPASSTALPLIHEPVAAQDQADADSNGLQSHGRNDDEDAEGKTREVERYDKKDRPDERHTGRIAPTMTDSKIILKQPL